MADDIRDVACDASSLGKPSGQDVALCRPSAARELGLEGAIHHFDRLVAAAIDAAAADGVLVPLQCEYYALEGLSMLTRILGQLRESGVNEKPG